MKKTTYEEPQFQVFQLETGTNVLNNYSIDSSIDSEEYSEEEYTPGI